jgi:CheY-like chemotaxis protein/HPt (histidine-containing phosphotransfer) domain-containing protein
MKSSDIDNIKLTFIQDARSKIVDIENLLLILEKQNNNFEYYVREVYLKMHSLKGSSKAFGIDIIASLCHLFEDNLTLVVNSNKTLDLELLNNMLQIVDTISEYFKCLVEQETFDDSMFREKHSKLLFLKESHDKILVNESSVRILLVGISQTMAKQSTNLLNKFPNVDIATTFDVLNALDRISKEHFDIVISAFYMNTMNGLTFLMSLKQEYNSKCPYLILNPSDKIDLSLIPLPYHPDKIIIKDEHFFDELLKTIKVFQQTKNSFINNKKSNTKVMFIDDNEYILDLYKDICEDKNIVTCFHNGEHLTIANVINFIPDIIICDIYIPSFDPLSFLKQIRTNSKLTKVPIVFISGEIEAPICHELLQNGATAVLNKTAISGDFFKSLSDIKLVI